MANKILLIAALATIQELQMIWIPWLSNAPQDSIPVWGLLLLKKHLDGLVPFRKKIPDTEKFLNETLCR